MKTEKYIPIKAQMFHFDCWITETIPTKLKEDFTNLLNKCGFTIVDFTEHYFPIKGYTCIWLLAESHLAIHTFPESDKTYVQISSCNDVKLEDFKKVFS